MDRVSSELRDVEVQDDQGRPVRLGEAWGHRICVLLFVRQFG